ncbi:hypothetical protein IFM89_037437 [Coptis chinensis]|uniref:MLO-like protein n=1 Tax=Coptis chinensis TaxID=261450 RepID=A0A835HQL3_9MAGN|nr:hypothetical protein IFM89_037437 [Coptis chinensis]
MAGGESSTSRQLDQTPTWAVATVVAIIIIISIGLEKVLHKLGTWFTDRHKKALFEALEKVKGELMVLGFISLILTFSQVYIAKICIPYKAADSMLPCPLRHKDKAEESSTEEHRRRLLWNDRRFLAGAASATTCKTGYESLISLERVASVAHFHILSCSLSCSIKCCNDDTWKTKGRKSAIWLGFVDRLDQCQYIRGWKEWEKDTLSQDYEFSNDPARFRLTHETSFVRAHTKFWTRIPILFYFVRSHNPTCSFLFFLISYTLWRPLLWGTLVIFLLLNVSGKYFFLPYEFGLKSCFHKEFHLIIVRLALGVGVQFLCSYITLPLYALVTQMGSNMKKSIFDEQTSRALKNWHKAAVKRKKAGLSPRSTPGVSPTQSPVHPLHRFQTTGHSARSSFTSRRYTEKDMSDIEADNSPTSSTANLIAHMDNGGLESETTEPYANNAQQPSNEDDFTFVKPEAPSRP